MGTNNIDHVPIAKSFLCNDNRLHHFGLFTENDLDKYIQLLLYKWIVYTLFINNNQFFL